MDGESDPLTFFVHGLIVGLLPSSSKRYSTPSGRNVSHEVPAKLVLTVILPPTAGKTPRSSLMMVSTRTTKQANVRRPARPPFEKKIYMQSRLYHIHIHIHPLISHQIVDKRWKENVSRVSSGWRRAWSHLGHRFQPSACDDEGKVVTHKVLHGLEEAGARVGESPAGQRDEHCHDRKSEACHHLDLDLVVRRSAARWEMGRTIGACAMHDRPSAMPAEDRTGLDLTKFSPRTNEK